MASVAREHALDVLRSVVIPPAQLPGTVSGPDAGATAAVASTTPVPAPVQPTVADQLVAPVAALRAAQAGDHQLVVRVSPQELGPVHVLVHVRDGVLDVRLAGVHELTREALRAALPDLRRELEAGGVRTGSVDVGPVAAGSTGTGAAGTGAAGTGAAGTGSAGAHSGSPSLGRGGTGAHDGAAAGAGRRGGPPGSGAAPAPAPDRSTGGSAGASRLDVRV